MLFYDLNTGIFEDIYGTIYDIFQTLQPWQVYLFKEHEKDYVFPDITDDFLVHLIYPNFRYYHVLKGDVIWKREYLTLGLK